MQNYMTAWRTHSLSHALRTSSLSDGLAIGGIFVLLSIPSLKLVYSSTLINAIPLLLLSAARLLILSRPLSTAAIQALVLWLAFSVALLSTGVMDAGDTKTIAKYAYHIVAVCLVILVASRSVMIGVGHLLVVWGAFIALWQLTLGVPTDRELGQHYLTVAMPMGAAIAYASASVLLCTRIRHLLLWLAPIALLLLALSTLPARAALLFSFSAALAVAMGYLMLRRTNASKQLVIVVGWVIAAPIIAAVAIRYIKFDQTQRMTRLFTQWESEPRMQKYLDAFSYIGERPLLGYGFGSSERLFGNHPHNLFLEIMTHGGVVLLLVFVPLLILFARSFWRMARLSDTSRHTVSFAAVAVFFFLQWNVSFPFSGAYIPVAALLLFSIGTYPAPLTRGVPYDADNSSEASAA